MRNQSSLERMTAVFLLDFMCITVTKVSNSVRCEQVRCKEPLLRMAVLRSRKLAGKRETLQLTFLVQEYGHLEYCKVNFLKIINCVC